MAQVEARVALDKPATMERVVAVLSDSGIHLTGATEAGVITGEWSDGTNTFYLSAVVTRLGLDSSRVRLSATFASPLLQSLRGDQGYRERLDDTHGGDGRKFWRKMEGMARAVEGRP